MDSIESRQPVAEGLSAAEIRLLLSFAEDHAYLVPELIRGETNGRRLLMSLEGKGFLEFLEDSEYRYSGPSAYRSRIEMAALSRVGRTLRDSFRALGFSPADLGERQRGLTESDVRLLLALRTANSLEGGLIDISTQTSVPVSTLHAVVARLSSLRIVSVDRGSYRLTAEGTGVADALSAWLSDRTTRRLRQELPVTWPRAKELDEIVSPDIDQLIVKCRDVFQSLLGVEPRSTQDTVLIVTDGKTQHIGVLFGIAADLLGVEHTLITMPIQRRQGELPALVAAALNHVTVLIALTTESITYAPAISERVRSTGSRFRVASIPAPTLSIISECIITDPVQLGIVRSETEAVADIVSEARWLRLRSDLGSDLLIERRPDDAVVAELGSALPSDVTCVRFAPTRSTNLLAGEVFFQFQKCTGLVVFDHLVDGYEGRVDGPVRVRIDENRVVEVVGGSRAAQMFDRQLRAWGITRVTSGNIGCNRLLRLRDRVVNDCKVAGNVNFGFGSDAFLRGSDRHPLVLSAMLVAGRVLSDDGTEMILDAADASIERRPGTALQ